MTDKEKIRAEIEKRYRENKADGYSDVCEELWDILSFIDSMQEDHNTSDWLQELEEMPDEQVIEILEKVNAWYNEQFANEESASEDLELAAKRILGGYACMGTFQDGKMYTEECMLDICMAGANWQKEKDVRDLFMSDNRNFKKCYELGKADMKQQMMKDAVDATIPIHGQIWIDNNTSYKAGDKVKIIIVRED